MLIWLSLQYSSNKSCFYLHFFFTNKTKLSDPEFGSGVTAGLEVNCIFCHFSGLPLRAALGWETDLRWNGVSKNRQVMNNFLFFFFLPEKGVGTMHAISRGNHHDYTASSCLQPLGIITQA
jgi:hypothetical protein